MFNQWISRITAATSTKDVSTVADIERVSAELLVEVARADHSLEEAEIQSITKALQQTSSLPDVEIEALVSSAVTDADAAVSLHEHIRLVNDQFDQDQKVMLIEQMWRVAAADGNIDSYEDYTIRKLSDLLYVRHGNFIQAKLRVLGD